MKKMLSKRRFFYIKRYAKIIFSFALILLFGKNIYYSKIFAETKKQNASARVLPVTPEKLPDDINFWSNYPDEVLAEAIVSRMSDEELYAQILMFGWAGAEPSELLNRWVLSRGLGSVKVFGWNTDNTDMVAKSIAFLQKEAQSRRFKIPLFVATDQEGGWIRHVKGDTSVTPGNMAIGASGYPIDAWYSGYYICREIAALGINMNFAPTVDLFTNQDSTIIGTRSFGADPESAGILGAAFSAGSLAAGVIPTAKHFPGHGDTQNDSHVYLPRIDIDLETFRNRELVPFKYIIASGTCAIMSGHLSFPEIRSNGEPASLSPYFLGEVLRKELGFDGLIITDDMMMNGDTLYAGSLTNAYKMAIEAGNDIIISSTTAKFEDELWVRNYSRMQTTVEFREKIVEAAKRVLVAKLKYFKGKNAAPLYPDLTIVHERIPDKEGQKFFFEQACRSITIYKRGDLPYTPNVTGRTLLAGSEPAFFSECKKRYTNTGDFKFSYSMGPNETQWSIDNILETATNYETIIFCVADKNSAKVANQLKSLQNKGKKIIIFSIMSPADSLNLEWADCVLFGYSYSPYTFQAIVGALAGEFEPQGFFPVTTTK